MQELFLTSNCHPFLELALECYVPAAHVRRAEVQITCRSQSLSNPITELIIPAASGSGMWGMVGNSQTLPGGHPQNCRNHLLPTSCPILSREAKYPAFTRGEVAPGEISEEERC